MFARAAAGGGTAAATGGADLLGSGVASGAPKPGAAMVGTNAGVGGRSVAAGNDGAPKAVLTAGVRRGGANGGTRPGGGLTGVGVLVVGAPAGAEDTVATAWTGGYWSATRAAGAGVVRVAAGADTRVSGKSSPQLTLAETGITPPQTEQRALTAAPTTLAGSTRKTDRHSGHDTFIHSSTMLMALGARGGVGSPPLAMKSVRRSTE